MAQNHGLLDNVLPNTAGHHVMNLYACTRRLIRAHIALRGHVHPNRKYLHRRRSGVLYTCGPLASLTGLLHLDEDLIIGDYRTSVME